MSVNSVSSGSSSRVRPLKRCAWPACTGRSGNMHWVATATSPEWASSALEVGSLGRWPSPSSPTMVVGAPRPSACIANARTIRRPRIDVSATVARRSPEMSVTTFNARSPRLAASGPFKPAASGHGAAWQPCRSGGRVPKRPGSLRLRCFRPARPRLSRVSGPARSALPAARVRTRITRRLPVRCQQRALSKTASASSPSNRLGSGHSFGRRGVEIQVGAPSGRPASRKAPCSRPRRSPFGGVDAIDGIRGDLDKSSALTTGAAVVSTVSDVGAAGCVRSGWATAISASGGQGGLRSRPARS